MEWQGVITTGEGDQPLGTRESVVAELGMLFPGLSFEWSRLGAEELALLDARGAELPDLVRRVIAAKPSSLSALLEDEHMSVSFNLGAGDPVTTIWATISGELSSAEAALARLRQRVGWVLTSPESLAMEEIGPNESLHLSGKATLFFETPQAPNAPPPDER